MDKNNRVVISGVGCISPFGNGVNVFSDSLFSGISAARQIKHFDCESLPTRFAASVNLSDDQLDELIPNKKSLKTLSRSGKLAMIAAAEAVSRAKITFDGCDPYRIGTSMGAGGLGLWDLSYTDQTMEILFNAKLAGTARSGAIYDDTYSEVWKNLLEKLHPLTPLKTLSNVPTGHIAIEYNARGPSQTITTACTSSAQAIGEAYRQIRYGVADVMIAGGSDAMINPHGIVAFSALGVLSRNNQEWQTASRPFDRRRNGFMLGEGAAVFVLESEAHCAKRGGLPIVELAGYANTCDAYRLTDSPARGWGGIACMKGALENAGLQPSEIDYINAHGTATEMNDRTETHAIKQVFGDLAAKIPISSTKSMIGHLVAAAGGIELVATLLALQNDRLPPTINYQVADPECDLDYVPNRSRQKIIEAALSNSFGFGGQNATLILKKPVD